MSRDQRQRRAARPAAAEGAACPQTDPLLSAARRGTPSAAQSSHLPDCPTCERAFLVERTLVADGAVARAEGRAALPGAWTIWRRSERRLREERQRTAARLMRSCQLTAIAVAVLVMGRGLERHAPDLLAMLRGLGTVGAPGGGTLALAVIALGLALALLGALRITWIES